MITEGCLKSLLDYDPSTGVFVWLVSPTRCVKVGQIAGCADGEGYVKIRIKGRAYKASRLAFLFMLGRWPSDEVDHKNGITSDDSWGNLRETDRAGNSLNRSRQKKNKSGYKGVCFQRNTGRWQAQIKCKKKCYYIGAFETPEAAHAAYVSAATKLHGEFARAA